MCFCFFWMDIYPRGEILGHSRGIIYPETFCSPAPPSSATGEGTYGWCFSHSCPLCSRAQGLHWGEGELSLGGSLGAVALLSGSESCWNSTQYLVLRMSSVGLKRWVWKQVILVKRGQTGLHGSLLPLHGFSFAQCSPQSCEAATASSLVYSWGNQRVKRLGDIPTDTHLKESWTQAAWLQDSPP